MMTSLSYKLNYRHIPGYVQTAWDHDFVASVFSKLLSIELSASTSLIKSSAWRLEGQNVFPQTVAALRHT